MPHPGAPQIREGHSALVSGHTMVAAADMRLLTALTTLLSSLFREWGEGYISPDVPVFLVALSSTPNRVHDAGLGRQWGS